MKTAIYIEDGVVQLVITPESVFEKDALKTLGADGAAEAKIFTGSFYDCRGGWVRQAHFSSGHPSAQDERSLIIRVGQDKRSEVSA